MGSSARMVLRVIVHAVQRRDVAWFRKGLIGRTGCAGRHILGICQCV